MDEILTKAVAAEINFFRFLINILTGFALSFLIVWHYKKYTASLSNHENFSRIFPLITLTTLFVITIVKSSLALSLGLVGALSIVRFRTPIKDPEELGYIFLAIAVGLGLGADRWLESIVALIAILIGITAYHHVSRKSSFSYMYLVINIDGGFDSKGDGIWHVSQIVDEYASAADIRRLELNEDSVEASFLVRLVEVSSISSLTKNIKSTWPNASVSFTEQRQNVFA